MMAEALGDGLLESLEKKRPQLATAVIGWVRDFAEPPAGVELRSNDGSTYTGLVIVERSRPILMLAVRQAPGAQPLPIVTPPPTHQRLYRRPHIEEEDNWDDEKLPNW